MKTKIKKRTITFLTAIMALLTLSFTPSEKRDPMKLYAQIDRAAAPNTLAPTEKKNGWSLLFDGKSTDGWHGYNLKVFPDCWVIQDGVFNTTSQDGHESLDIITNKKYHSFAFSADFKLIKGTNSGIIFQVSENSKYKYPYETGPEFQIIDQANWPDPLEDWQICGANYAMYPPKSLPSKPVGEWNNLMLVVDGNHVTQIINGVVVVEYEKYSEDWNKHRNSGKWKDFPDWGKFDEGFISLQNHGTKVSYRNIKIKEF
jgi:hypothetical protein